MNKRVNPHILGMIAMVAGSVLAIRLSGMVPQKAEIPETVAATVSEVPEVKEPETIVPEREVRPDTLNLVYEFPEGADGSNVLNSIMGEIYQELEIMDQNWLENIYNLSGMTPEQMAQTLGRPVETVRGSYDPRNANQNKEDPATWKIEDWKRIQITILDGEQTQAQGDSNVKKILSMANVYSYYHDYRDKELFLEYAKELWNASHSYTVTMSDVYYCDGCLDKTEEEELEEEIAQMESEERNGFGQGNDQQEAQPISQETAGISETSAAVVSAENTGSPEELGDVPQEVIYSQSAVSTASEMSGPGVRIQELENQEATEEATEAAAEEVQEETYLCPGHIDLNITVHIMGAEDEESLYRLDSRGNTATENWPEWTEETRGYVNSLMAQDWYGEYGLTISDISLQPPISSEQIDAYMADLPEGTSQERKNIVQFALESVGRIPYYWGGKPVTKGYLGNMFGTVTEPDHAGRNRKGLDCSGWINWVYWSVTGECPTQEGTSGLIRCGTGIPRSQLQPGDIVVRTGSNAHVIMFLNWTADGKMRCVHETSGAFNNVVVSEMDANWKYCRNLLD